MCHTRAHTHTHFCIHTNTFTHITVERYWLTFVCACACGDRPAHLTSFNLFVLRQVPSTAGRLSFCPSATQTHKHKHARTHAPTHPHTHAHKQMDETHKTHLTGKYYDTVWFISEVFLPSPLFFLVFLPIDRLYI